MNYLTKLISILLIGFVFSGCTSNIDKIIGIKIYEYKGDFFVLAARFKNPEILKQDSTLYAITNKGTKAKNGWSSFHGHCLRWIL